GISQGGISDQDRTYLAQLVSQRTGIGQDEAQRRVSDVENKAKETAKDTADKAAKAGAYLSFWMFMALLFGATAATLAGIEGGSLRDRDSFGRRAAAVGEAFVCLDELVRAPMGARNHESRIGCHTAMKGPGRPLCPAGSRWKL